MPFQVPPKVTFRGFPASAAIEADVREKIAKLETFFDRITSCRVTVESLHRRHHKGNLYHVSIDVQVPGTSLVVNRAPAEHAAHQDVYVAIRDAFDDVRRELQDYVAKRRRQVKNHQAPPHARVVRLFADDGYGFLETPEGLELYFHRNSVLGAGFENLDVGTEVRFAEEAGDKGPQATSVEVVGRAGKHVF